MRMAVLLLLAILLPMAPARAVERSDYLPAGVDYDPAIPRPADVLGSEVGTWHARHDQILEYMELLAARSDRVRLIETGRTHENRPLLLLVFASPERLANLDAVRARHVALGDEGASPGPHDPAVVWLAYSIHGNEASGANAALLVAYHLAAARGPEIEDLLANLVILIDPAQNPDGLDRFAQWANGNRSRDPVADPAAREHQEPWPSGRGNHYVFDLNRDWLLLTQPESRARVEVFHRWKPNVVSDFHEMGSDATYFFQPGVPARRHPLTPAANVELTARIAAYHASALDAENRLYYTEETFDDFYCGKGSTYPDLNGGVGILFEQASARGHVQETRNGRLTFPFAIQNQVITSLSTLRAARDLRAGLLDLQERFPGEARREAERGRTRGWVFSDAGDHGRGRELVDLLLAHHIEVHALARPMRASGEDFAPGSAWLVPAAQAQARLARAVFETPTAFADSVFYDVSAWTLPLAFGLPFAELEGDVDGLRGERLAAPPPPGGRFDAAPADSVPYAWAFAWNEYFAPLALNRLLEAGVVARAAIRPFTARTAAGPVAFERGAVVIPAGLQARPVREIVDLLARAAVEDGVTVERIAGGLTPDGIDLGSPALRPLTLPKPLLVTGEGVSGTEAGEIWHLLDHRFGVDVVPVDGSRVASLDLARYTHIILVDGGHAPLEKAKEAVARWVENGGVLIATRSAAKWVAAGEIAPVAFREAKADSTKPETPPAPLPYAEFAARRAAAGTTGAILRLDLDLTHPLAYGCARAELAVLRNHNLLLEPDANPHGTVARYAQEPLLAGYVEKEQLGRIAGSAGLIARRVGKGAVVLFADDPAFRGIAWGANRLFLNAIFFGSIIDKTGE